MGIVFYIGYPFELGLGLLEFQVYGSRNFSHTRIFIVSDSFESCGFGSGLYTHLNYTKQINLKTKYILIKAETTTDYSLLRR